VISAQLGFHAEMVVEIPREGADTSVGGKRRDCLSRVVPHKRVAEEKIRLRPFLCKHAQTEQSCAFGAVKAWTAYCIASNEVETKRRVDLDTCIAAMAMTAKDMNPKYKETSEAGLAALVLC
jgi:hypothetical protein